MPSSTMADLRGIRLDAGRFEGGLLATPVDRSPSYGFHMRYFPETTMQSPARMQIPARIAVTLSTARPATLRRKLAPQLGDLLLLHLHRGDHHAEVPVEIHPLTRPAHGG